MSSFYITLISDSSMELFPNNTQCCFRTKLSKPIMLDKQIWEIVTKNTDIGGEFAKKNGTKETDLQCSISEGTYATPNHLVEELDKAIKESVGELLKQKKC